jgi:site-specific recombinase XerD
MPKGHPLRTNAVTCAIQQAFRRSGLEIHHKGAHVLRHTAATRMVRCGASLKEIADVLRHRCLETTMIYAKVDIAALAEVAMPWPGLQP